MENRNLIKLLKTLAKWILYISLLPVLYLVIALIFSMISVNRNMDEQHREHNIFLTTNGIHLGIVLPISAMKDELIEGLEIAISDKYLSFGWGDKNFYLNTPTWGDLTFANAFRAAFLKSATLLHVTRFKEKQPDWLAINISADALNELNNYLLNSFQLDDNGMKIILSNKGYSNMDDFYFAKGNYSLFNTCNTWVNTGFKRSGIKACLWTPFDFALLRKHQ
jgi:uncharacterized protein (TIGR02117 family)